METTAETDDLSTEPKRGDGYVYRVHVSRNRLQHKRNGQNPATLYRHKIDRWTPKRVFVEKQYEALRRGEEWERHREYEDGCYSMDRAELEEDGRVRHRPARDTFHLHREDAEAVVEKHEPDIPDCLDTLGLDRGATEADVREAFRSRSKELHPDHGGDAGAFRRLRDAYEDALKTV